MAPSVTAPARAAPTKPVVLVFIKHYLPGFLSGGPVRSVASLVAGLKDQFSFYVVCLDRDWTGGRYAGMVDGQWREVDGARVLYVRKADLMPWRLARTLRGVSPVVVYFNSLFDPVFTLIPLTLYRLGWAGAPPCLVAPRGELSPGALAIKAFRKRAHLTLSRVLGVYGRAFWHACSAEERDDIEREFAPAGGRVLLAANIPTVTHPAARAREPKRPDALRMVFLSRISPKKNLEQAIRIASQVPGEIVFDIWGPVEDPAYWRRCEAAIGLCPATVRVTNRGVMPHERVADTLAGYDAFLLPSLGENFGHAIWEALACGVPVFVSDRTPWRRLAGLGVGYDLPLADPAAFVRALTEYCRMGEAEHSQRRKACIEFAQRWRADNVRLDDSRAALLTVIQSGGRTTPPVRNDDPAHLTE